MESPSCQKSREFARIRLPLDPIAPVHRMLVDYGSPFGKRRTLATNFSSPRGVAARFRKYQYERQALAVMLGDAFVASGERMITNSEEFSGACQ